MGGLHVARHKRGQGRVYPRKLGGRQDALTPTRIRTFKKYVPLDFPGFALNRLSVRTFNEAYYHLHRLKKKKVRQHYSTYFFTLLDSILNWNRLYPHGFQEA